MGARVTECAYAAGFFDGEGSAYLARRDKQRKTPTLLVCISNTNLAVLEWHQAIWGGSICARRVVKERHRPQWQWVLAPRQAAVFLTDIAPHLRIKRDLAILALELAAEMSRPAKERVDYSQRRWDGRRWRTAPQRRPEHIDRIETIAAKMSALNARGFNAMRRAA